MNRFARNTRSLSISSRLNTATRVRFESPIINVRILGNGFGVYRIGIIEIQILCIYT